MIDFLTSDGAWLVVALFIGISTTFFVKYASLDPTQLFVAGLFTGVLSVLYIIWSFTKNK